MNEAVARLGASLGMGVALFDTAPSSLSRSPAVRLARMLRVARAGARAWVFALRRRGATLYFSLSGGWGMLYEALMVAGSRLLGARVIVHHHSFRYLDEPFWPLSVLAGAAGPRATHVVLGEGMGELLRKRCPGVGETLVLSNAVFVPSASPGAQRALGTVGYLANLSWEKGLQQVMDTAELCNARGLPLQFVVAGPFEHPDVEASFRRRSAGIQNLRYLGPVYAAEKERFFDEIDLFIFPTLYRHEAEPLVVLEALSHWPTRASLSRGAALGRCWDPGEGGPCRWRARSRRLLPGGSRGGPPTRPASSRNRGSPSFGSPPCGGKARLPSRGSPRNFRPPNLEARTHLLDSKGPEIARPAPRRHCAGRGCGAFAAG